MKRLPLALIFVVWVGIILSIFYGIQKPLFVVVAKGFADTLWAITVWLLLVINGLGIGNFLVNSILKIPLQSVERVLVGGGIGLGTLGFIGFILGILGWSSLPILLGSQLLLGWLFHKNLIAAWHDFRETYIYIQINIRKAPNWVRVALGLTLLFAFLLALAPPAEAFDALFYHLVEPERIIRNGGLVPYSIPHSWFPALPEGIFLLAQGMVAVRATQFIHITWAVLSMSLIWYWAQEVWDTKAAHMTLVIILSMPSFYLLASWSYTDFTLVFFGLAGMYGVYKTCNDNHAVRWIILSGIAAGMAMGVKYTSFLVPVMIVLLICLWQIKHIKQGFKLSCIFGLSAVVTASPWYLRNLFVMGNPFYPFMFGGIYWDAFRADWYAQQGTGIGWNIKELFLLPFNATLGHRDANYYDGRIGPLFLTLAPLTFYALVKFGKGSRDQAKTLYAITLFCVLSLAAWTLGVVNSSALWQTRLLFPALIPFSLPTALGLLEIQKLDTQKLKLSFIINFFIIVVLTINLVDAGIFVIQRNPLAHAVGIESTEAYLKKTQPAYGEAVGIVGSIPQNAKIYALYEPRSFYMDREVHPDPILDNLAHDIYLYGNPEDIIQAWGAEGYTHVLLNRAGLDFLLDHSPQKFTRNHEKVLTDIIQSGFEMVTKTDDGSYELYEINFGP